MEEDIKVLEELINGAKEFNQYNGNKYYKAIENLINRNKELEKEQEQNRKELDIGLNCLSNKMIDSACDKISINMSIEEYLQELLQEGDE